MGSQVRTLNPHTHTGNGHKRDTGPWWPTHGHKGDTGPWWPTTRAPERNVILVTDNNKTRHGSLSRTANTACAARPTVLQCHGERRRTFTACTAPGNGDPPVQSTPRVGWVDQPAGRSIRSYTCLCNPGKPGRRSESSEDAASLQPSGRAGYCTFWPRQHSPSRARQNPWNKAQSAKPQLAGPWNEARLARNGVPGGLALGQSTLCVSVS